MELSYWRHQIDEGFASGKSMAEVMEEAYQEGRRDEAKRITNVVKNVTQRFVPDLGTNPYQE